MEPRIEHITETNLIGFAMDMSLDNDRTVELFSKFMPRRHEIENTIGSEIFEVMIYNNSDFNNFKPSTTFTKWVSLAVSESDPLPEEMDRLILKQGLYAVFTYNGEPANFGGFMRYIFTNWIPGSVYELDDRPHFNILGENYRNGQPDSEEVVYIPVKIIE